MSDSDRGNGSPNENELHHGHLKPSEPKQMTHPRIEHASLGPAAAQDASEHGVVDHSAMEHGSMDHGKMNHAAMSGHGSMDHGQMSGHAGHGADHVAQFRRLFWIMLLLAIPVVAFSPMFSMLLGYEIPDMAGIEWISLFSERSSTCGVAGRS